MITGEITEIKYECKNSMSDLNDDYGSDDESEEPLFFIIITIIDKDTDFKKYTLKGNSFVSPEIGDIAVCKNYKVNEKNRSEYISDFIEINYPNKKDKIIDRINSKIRIKSIGKATINNFIEKYIDSIWNKKNPLDDSYLEKEKLIIKELNKYIDNKKNENQQIHEQLIIFFKDIFDIDIKTFLAKRICDRLEIITNKIIITKEYIKEKFLELIGVLSKQQIDIVQTSVDNTVFSKKCVNILNLLHDNKEKGSTCLNKLKYFNNKEYEDELKYLEDNNFISIYKNKYIYLTHDYNIEKYISKKLVRYTNDNNYIFSINEEDINKKLTDEQKQCVLNAFNEPVSIITGFPGVGKTMTAIEIAKLCKKYSINILLLGPTGKIASKIINDLCKENLFDDNVFTIHRFIGKLKYINTKEDTRDDDMTNIDIIIIDEISMVDNDLFADFLEVISEKMETHLVFMGDTEQLPSIKQGYLLNSLIKSKIIKTEKLTKILRSDGDINRKIENIRNNDNIEFNNNTFKFQDANCIEQIESVLISNINSILSSFEYEYDKEIKKDKKYKKKDFSNILIITPQRNTILKLSDKIKYCINKDNYDPINFCIGDYVMVKKNVYYRNDGNIYDKLVRKKCESNECNNCPKCKMMYISSDLYNGSIGKIINFSDDYYQICLIDSNIKIHISKVHIKKYFMYAYINTVHKYQGSENNVVIFIVNDIDKKFINKNMIYTALSRSKDKCIVIGDRDIFEAGRKRKCNRNTKLDKMIKKESLKYKHIDDIKIGDVVKNTKKIIKKPIPKTLRRMVWDLYIGEEFGIGKCECCSKVIKQFEFHCGHVKSEANGGETSVENLRPICALCNLSMGKKNMDEFMKTYKLNSPSNSL